MIAGVAGGLGEYFTVDQNIIRMIFILLTVFGGSGVLIYLILWIVMPSTDITYQQSNNHIHDNLHEIRMEAERFAQQFHSSSKENRRCWIALVLITFGLLFLLNNFGLFYFIDVGKLWPIILIIFGLMLFIRRQCQ